MMKQENAKWTSFAFHSETPRRINQISSSYSEDAAKVFRSLSIEESPPVSIMKISSSASSSPRTLNMTDRQRPKSATRYKHVTFQSDGRILYPGEKRRKSTASILMEIKAMKSKNKRTPADDIQEDVHVSRKVSKDELEDIVARLGQPTASSFRKIRSAPVRTVCFQTPNKTQISHVNYFTFDSGRFKGLRKVNLEEMKAISNRLSSYNKEKVPDSKRLLPKHLTETLGLMNSYRWKGIKDYKV